MVVVGGTIPQRGIFVVVSRVWGGGEGIRLVWASKEDSGGGDGGSPSLYESMVENVPMSR